MSRRYQLSGLVSINRHTHRMIHVDLKGQFNTTDAVIGDETTRHALSRARHEFR